MRSSEPDPRRRRPAALPGVLLACLLLVGCSPERLLVRPLADAVARSGEVHATDDDPDLIAAATPFALKAIESLIVAEPGHRGLRLAAARGFTQYAYAFVQMPADEIEERDVAAAYLQRDRARRLYVRARDHGLAGLGIADDAGRERFFRDPAACVAALGKADVPLMYWTAVAGAAAVALGKDSPALIATLPTAEALALRAEALDPDFDRGGLQVFLLALESGRPGAPGDPLVSARRRFARAVVLSEGRQAAPYVAFAEVVAAAHGSAEEFRALIGSALAVDASRPDAWRLANLVSQRRARWLLTQNEVLFPE
jgi:hypothetical protein